MIFGREPLSLLAGFTGFIFRMTAGLLRFLNSFNCSLGVFVKPVIFSTYLDLAASKPLVGFEFDSLASFTGLVCVSIFNARESIKKEI